MKDAIYTTVHSELAVCAKRALNLLAPHWPGTWKLLDQERDHDGDKNSDAARGFSRWATYERAEDGTRIHFSGSKVWNDAPGTFTVSAGRHYYTNKREYADQIDNRWLFRALSKNSGYAAQDALPSAKINANKRNAKTIAADILRRVIEPCAAVMPDVRKLQAERAAADDYHGQVLARLGKLKGTAIGALRDMRHHELRHKASGLDFEIHSGGVKVQSFTVAPEHVADLIAWVQARKVD